MGRDVGLGRNSRGGARRLLATIGGLLWALLLVIWAWVRWVGANLGSRCKAWWDGPGDDDDEEDGDLGAAERGELGIGMWDQVWVSGDDCLNAPSRVHSGVVTEGTARTALNSVQGGCGDDELARTARGGVQGGPEADVARTTLGRV